MTHPNTALIGTPAITMSFLSSRGEDWWHLTTTRNTAAFDILVTTPDSTRHANIQVKSVQKRVSFFRMPASSRIRVEHHDFYVLLRWLPRENRYEGYMLNGGAARVEVQRGEDFQKGRMADGTRRMMVPSIYVGRKIETRAR